jgi:hypothetical protein
VPKYAKKASQEELFAGYLLHECSGRKRWNNKNFIYLRPARKIIEMESLDGAVMIATMNLEWL